MSTSICVLEMLDVKNETKETAKLLEKLVEYLQQFNHMESLESLSIRRLTLTADGQTVLLEDIDEVESGNTYFFDKAGDGSPEFVGQLQIERPIWPDNSPLIQLLKRIQKAHQVHMELYADIMILMGKDYGYTYFQSLLEESAVKETLAEYVTYKNLECYDSDPYVAAYCFEKTSEGIISGQPEFTDDLSVIEDIQVWRDGNFGFTISGNGTLCTPEEFEELAEAAREFHSFFDDEECANGIGDLDETDGETYLNINSSPAYIPQEQIEQFREFLQYFYDFALSHQADFGFEGNFTPDSQEAFARLTFFKEDGEIVPKAMRY